MPPFSTDGAPIDAEIHRRLLIVALLLAVIMLGP